jgi:hypothetical protein
MVDIQVIHAGGLYPDQHLARAGGRGRKLFDGEKLIPAGMSWPNNSHNVLPGGS